MITTGSAKTLVAQVDIKGLDILQKNSAASNLKIEANCTGKTSVEVTLSEP